MLFVILSPLEVEDVVGVRRAIGLNKSQQLDLVERLVNEVLAVGHYFEAGKLFAFGQ